MMPRYEIIESHGLYASSDGGIRQRIRYILAERIEDDKPLRELCSCGAPEIAERIRDALCRTNE